MKKSTIAFNLLFKLLFAIWLCSTLVWCQNGLGSGDRASSLPTITPPSAPPPNSSDSSDTNFETTNPTHLKATTAAPTPRDSQDSLHTDLPSENPTFQCYKKAYGLNSTVTTCTARSHGCYETERYVCMDRNGVGRDNKMGCLKSPCKPLKKNYVIRQCCNTSLCNDLDKRPSLFLPYQPPPPTLPPLSPVIQQSGGYIICDSPTHQEESCYSMYGCYTLRDYRNRMVLNRTCIDRPDFKFCVEPVLIDWMYATCCYDGHYCNAANREKRYIRHMGNTTELPSTGVTDEGMFLWSAAFLLLIVVALAIILCTILAFRVQNSVTRNKTYSCESATTLK